MLIIFIDSFPYDFLERTHYLKTFIDKKRLIPGLGYSRNVIPELLAGKQADTLGYFNEWALASINNRHMREKTLGKLLRYVHFYPLLNLVLHRGLRLLTERFINIPFHLQGYFSRNKGSVFEDAISPKFSHLPNFEVILSERIGVKFGQRDKLALQCAQRTILNKKSLFLSLVDLDGFAHKYGTYSNEYLAHIHFLDEQLTKLVSSYKTVFGSKSKIMVISDHGMSDVKHGVNLRIEQVIGPAKFSSYLYFIDSTMIRFWVLNEGIRKRIETYLDNLSIGKIINKPERKKYGLSLRSAGDILYVLDEGYIFAPDFFRHRKAKAMHGYHPDYPSQHGIFLSTELYDDADVIKSSRVSSIISEWIASEQ